MIKCCGRQNNVWTLTSSEKKNCIKVFIEWESICVEPQMIGHLFVPVGDHFQPYTNHWGKLQVHSEKKKKKKRFDWSKVNLLWASSSYTIW